MTDMTRADLLTYINGTFGVLALSASVPTTDTYAGFKGALDTTYVALGLTPDSTIPSAGVPNALIVLNYLAIKRMQLNAGSRVDIRLGSTGAQKSSSQLMTNLTALLKQAMLDMVQAGIETSLATTMLEGELTLDILEPSAT